MRVSYILLDLDNTLYDTRKSEGRALAEFIDIYASGRDKMKLIREYRSLNLGLWEALEKGEIGIEGFNQRRFREFFKKAEIAEDAKKAADHYIDLLVKHHTFLPYAQEIYEYLTSRYTVLLVTNGLKQAQRKRITGTFLDEEKTPMYIGEETGYSKPDKEFVHYIARQHNCELSEMMIIGDSLSSDIKCAENAGISSIWCNFRGEQPNGANIDYEVKSLKEIEDIL